VSACSRPTGDVGGNSDQICIEERLHLRRLAPDSLSEVVRVTHGVPEEGCRAMGYVNLDHS
jgi:hypothetical protein